MDKSVSQSVADNEDLSSTSFDTDVYQEMIQQFYESSIQRYGLDSEQCRMLEVHLTAHSGGVA